MKVLFLTSEAHPLIKTGGLGDVAGALPAALRAVGVDARLMLPGYPRAMALAENKGKAIPLGDPLGVGATRIVPATFPDCGTIVYLVDCPNMFGREGNPYVDARGHDWPDNGQRFALLAKVATMCCSLDEPLGWRPQVLHASDWQTGLASAYLHFEPGLGPATVFTIHNIQFQGLFPAEIVERIDLPPESYAIEGLEFYGRASYLKAGLYYSDAITTVSPSYAEEIKTKNGGWGMDGLLTAKADRLSGVLNGVDYAAWNPNTDAHIPHAYSVDDMSGKAADKRALQEEMGLNQDPGAPLLGVVSRLVEQKGLDLLLPILDDLLTEGTQIAVLGSGEEEMELALTDAASRHSGRISAHIGYDEGLSHRIQAGSDFFLMPSRREPCGLTQLYALRYGTLPVVHKTGGLADTVTDMSIRGKGTGFVFDAATSEDFFKAIRRGIDLYRNHLRWRAAQKRAMRKSFSWAKAAKAYKALYLTLT